MKKLYLFSIVVLLVACSYSLQSQLVVDGSLAKDPVKLVKEKLVGSGVDVKNVRFKGSDVKTMPSIGTFDGTNSNIGLSKGIIISTGSIFDAPGPNISTKSSSLIQWRGDLEMDSIVSSITYDASVLEFDFVPVSKRIEFRYVFASEEYEEFVCSQFNDAFAFLLSGPGINRKNNIALVPGTSDIVSINTVNNGCRNAKFDSADWCSRLHGPCYSKNKYSFIGNEAGSTVEYDGFTKVFVALCSNLIPGETYHLKIVIADVGDHDWDSGVFLEGNSLKGNYSLDFTSSCFNDLVFFWSSATGEASFYKWDFGDGTYAFQESPSHMYSKPGNYKVQLFIELPDGKTRDTLIRYITISDLKADFSYKNDLNDWKLYNFNDESTIANGTITEWEWDFGDGIKSGQQNPAHKYKFDGYYTIRLIVTSENGCKDTVYQNIRFSTKYIEANSMCINDSVQFNVVTAQKILKYKWEFGDGDSSDLVSPGHLYESVGSYLARVMLVDDKNQNDTIVKMINVSDVKADFDISIDYSKGGVVSFNDKSTAYYDNISGYYWNFGDGTSSVLSSPSHTFSEIKEFNVILVVTTENGCMDTIAKPVNLMQNNFGTTGDCAKSPVYFNISSKWKNYSAEWDFGDGEYSFDKAAVHFYNSTGIFNVRLIVSDLQTNTKDTLFKIVTIYGIDAAFDYETSGGNNPRLKFKDNSNSFGDSIIQRVWDFGDGNTSIEQNPVYRYRNEGTYIVKLTVVGEHGCVDTAIAVIDITDITNRIVTREECAGIPCNFRIEGKWNITACKWNFGDGYLSDDISASHVYTKGGDYMVSALITNENSQMDSLSYMMRIDDIESGFEINKDKSYNLEAKFTDKSVSVFSNIATWFWDFGDGTKSAEQNPVHIYPDNSYRRIILIVTNEAGCTDTIIKYLNEIEVSQNCAGDIIDFKYTTLWDNTTCEWDFGDSSTSVAVTPEHAYEQPGKYLVKVIIKNMNTNEFDTLEQWIDVSGAEAGFDYDSIGSDFDYQFNDKSSIVNGTITNWYWNFGDNAVSREQNPFHEYSDYGVYKVTFIITTDLGCRDTIFKMVNNFGKANCVVSIPDTCMNTGDTLRLPVFLESQSYLNASKNYEFDAVIRFDKSLLLPLQSLKYPYTFDETDCIITIKGNRQNELQDFNGKKVLAWLDLFVLWGSYQEIDIVIENFEWTDGYEADIITDNAKFCILDLCPVGGTRLYYSSGAVELLAPKPNPAEDFIELEFEVLNDGSPDLFITDIYGKRMGDVSNSRILPGRYSLRYDTDMLPSGIYYITLRTITETITHKFVIEK